MLLEAAFELFLARGFAATTIEQVADTAAVSRQTVYAHLGDDGDAKETLFRAMVEAQVGRRDDGPHPLEATMPLSDRPHRDLQAFARHHLRLVMTPELVRLRRMLIGEAERFPALAATWYENGPEQSFALFAGWFQAWHDRGMLDVPDPMSAGRTFNWLVLSTPLNAAMAHPDAHYPGEDLDRHADEGVRVFLSAHGHQRPPGCPECEQPLAT